MAVDKDGTLEFDVDVPAMLKGVDEMLAQTESRFARAGKKLGGFLSGMFGGSPNAGSGAWSQTPAAKTTKEMEQQVKHARDLLKAERDRRDVQRAARFEANRGKYGPDAELTETGELRRQQRDLQRQRTIGHAAGFIRAGGQAAFGGGSFQSTLSAGTGVANMLAPAFAPLISAISEIAMKGLNADDTRVEAGLRGYQSVGASGANAALNGSGQGKNRLYRGFTYDRFSSMQSSLARRTGNDNGLDEVMALENSHGLGGQAQGLLGANARSGNNTANIAKPLGAAFGLAVSENIGKGRMGEILDQLASAMEANTKGVADVGDIADRFLFISQLGEQYKGNTRGSQEMNSSIMGLGQGSKPYTQMAMLKAAGFGQKGVTYQEAWLKSQFGVGVAGGIQTEDLITANFGSYIPAYAKGSKQTKASIIYTISQLTGMNGAQVKVIMDRLAAGPMGHIDSGVGFGQMNAATGDANVNKLLFQHKTKAAGEDTAASVGNWTHKAAAGVIGAITGNQIGADIMKRGGAGGIDSVGGIADPFSGGSATSPAFVKQYGSQNPYGKPGPGGKPHPGVDLTFPPGTKIYSKWDGIVLYASAGTGMEIGWGMGIKEAVTGLVWKLYHLDPKKPHATTGQKVKVGDLLGQTLPAGGMGGTPHLHVGVGDSAGVNGQTYDPTTKTDLEGLIHPTIESGGGGGPITSSGDAGSSGAGAGAGAGSGPVTSPGGVSINLNINDRTQGGVNVQHETAVHKARAAQPAPGDAPATTNRNS